MKPAALGSLFTLLSSLMVHAGADWPMFRGNPALTGLSDAKLPDKLQLRWSFKTGGPVLSSAAIVGGTVFVGGGDEKLYALRLSDGHKLWEFKAGGPIESSPLVLDGRVFFGDSITNFFALNAADGKPVWRYGLEEKVKSSATWTPSPTGSGKWILVGGYDFKLHCLDAATGKTNWIYETGNYINGSPAIGDGVTAFGGCDAIVHVVSVADGKKLKEIEAGAYIAASGAMADGKLYVGHYENEFLSVDLKKGEVQWRYRDRAFPFMSSPAVTKDRIVVGSHDKRLHCLKRETGEAVWTFPTRGKVQSSPVVAGDRVIVGSDDGRLYIVGLADGKEVSHYEIGQPVQTSPAVVDGAVVVGADDGSIYCLGPAK